MLTNITIQNIILIDNLDIDFVSGLCVLTGETGAGKSIVLDSLGFSLGARSTGRLLKVGCSQGTSCATFDIKKNDKAKLLLDEQSIEHEGYASLRRVIYKDGRTKAFINDTPVGASLLKELSNHLIEIHGQHDQSDLLNNSKHLGIIDQYGLLSEHLSEVQILFEQYKSALQELETTKISAEEDSSEIEYLKYCLQEMDDLSYIKGEIAELEAKRKKLINKEKLAAILDEALASLASDSGAADSVAKAESLLSKSLDMHEEFADLSKILERSSIEISEAISRLDRLNSELQDSDDDIEYVESRLHKIKLLVRKFNLDDADLLDEHYQEIAAKIDLYENADSKIAELEKTLQKSKEQYLYKAKELTKLRLDAASKLESDIHDELKSLKMQSTRFKVVIEALPENSWGAKGIDKVHFTASTNPGQPFTSLAKIASGGELSRFMLAIKVALSDVTSVPVLIFDEVDTGIGGAVADAVGRRLEILGSKLQILVITHQPQVAAKASYHLKVQKIQQDAATRTEVFALDDKQRQEELARMLSGSEVTGEARAAALKLLSETR